MPDATDPRPGTVRPGGRSARNREAVFAAAIEELNATGFGGLSAARIADRAGVHRTTVHRRWPDLNDLIAEALIETAASNVATPDEGDVRADLRALMRAIADLVGTEQAQRTIRNLISDTARSDTIGAVLTRVWTERFQVGEHVIVRAINRGELRNDIDPTTVFSSLIGPIYLRVLITSQQLDDQFIEDVITLTLDGARPR
jgi:AcrR family transcriptional regulator